MAEVAVHFTLATLPEDYVMVTINVPDEIESEILSPNPKFLGNRYSHLI